MLVLHPLVVPAAEEQGLEAVSQFSKITKIIQQQKKSPSTMWEALDVFIHPLCTPDRRCITYDAPADHLHHRALCVGGLMSRGPIRAE